MAGETILVIDDSPTIIKVVELVLTKAGYKIISASDGVEGIEKAREEKPDMVLLDFVMPKMNGYQVCKHFSESPDLSSIPVVLMSAKGEQVGERFVKVMGIVDYITKPFSPEAITAVVSHTLSRGAEITEEPVIPQSREEVAEEADFEARVWKQALAKLRNSLARTIGSSVASIDSGFSDDETLFNEIKNTLSDQFLEGCLGELRSHSPKLAAESDSGMTGDLSIIPVSEIFFLLQNQRQTGILTVSKNSTKVDIYFNGGRIDLASAAGISEEYLLGRYVIDLGLMSRNEMDEFLSIQENRNLLGLQLVKQSKLTETEVKQAMTLQTRELCYELLRWNNGRFAYRLCKPLPAVAIEASLGLNVDSILIEGFRKVDEWHVIEREIDDFDIVLLRNDDAIVQIGRHKLEQDELTVLELINGRNTIRDIIRKSRMGSFDVTKMLYRLLSSKLVRKRVSAVAT
ncbi:response regulator [Myxococcota bacterium]|nr:response regulator [Myxococcota bacterium]MBU1381330.1 response regulator [Myxococcota bacterium]MBU1495707.1 response regulator [Myxococcota bacterium]